MTETSLHAYGADSAPIAFSPIQVDEPYTNAKPGDFHTKGLMAVIPAYNEEVTIGSVVIQAKQYVEKVIVVDDGSVDRTSEIAKLAGAETIRLDKNTGKAYALLLGLRTASEMGCKACIMMDADGQHHARDIPRLASWAMSGSADLVIGSRFLKKNAHIPAYRQVGQKTLDLLTNIGTRQNVTDSQSGYRALSRKALDYIDFASDGYNLESDMIAHFVANGLVLKEVPIDITYDVPNKHKKNPITHGMGVSTRLINMISYRRPLLAFGVPGSAMIVAGMITEVWVFADFFTSNQFHYLVSIGSAFVLVLGMLLLIAGLILNTLVLIVTDKR